MLIRERAKEQRELRDKESAMEKCRKKICDYNPADLDTSLKHTYLFYETCEI